MCINEEKIDQFKAKIINDLIIEFKMPRDDAETWAEIWASLLEKWSELRITEV